MSNVVVKNEPELPLKFVYYADLYGDFIGFAKEEGGQRYMCSCSKIALLNKIDLVKKYCPSLSIFGRSSQEIFSISDEDLYSPKSILDKIVFKNKICHQCNKKMPTKKYCHEMYGGKFKQAYGWYIEKKILELGIYQYRLFLDDSTIPIELLKLVKIDYYLS